MATNKRVFARAVALFHEGRGAQQAMFAELKSQYGLRLRAVPKEVAYRAFALAVLAHRLRTRTPDGIFPTPPGAPPPSARRSGPSRCCRRRIDSLPTFARPSRRPAPVPPDPLRDPFVRHLDRPEPRRRLAVIDLAQSHRHPLAIEQKTL